MQKIKLSVLNKMIEKKCTRTEIDFILYIAQFQNESGIVNGVYYKEICEKTGISYQKFYDIKKSLSDKGIIRQIKDHYTDWEIQFINNDFTNLEALKEGYISVSHSIFYDKKFKKLKAGAKLLAMEFLKISYAGQGKYCIGVDKFIEKYKKMFMVSKRVLHYYLNSLKKFFSIGIKDKKCWITPLTKVYRKNGADTDADKYNRYIGKQICRREKIQFTYSSLKDTADLMKQYAGSINENVVKVLKKAIKLSIEKVNEEIKNHRFWKKQLQPKLVHKILRNEILGYSN